MVGLDLGVAVVEIDYFLAAIQTVLTHDMGDPDLLPQLVQAGNCCQGSHIFLTIWRIFIKSNTT